MCPSEVVRRKLSGLSKIAGAGDVAGGEYAIAVYRVEIGDRETFGKPGARFRFRDQVAVVCTLRHYSNWRIGLDLDNTLISYDRSFCSAAIERSLVPADFVGSKRDVRDRVRLLPAGELQWQRLQAHVYG
jgi:hypothetical protein